MKQARVRITDEMLKEFLLWRGHDIKIVDVEMVNGREIHLIVQGDALPDRCALPSYTKPISAVEMNYKRNMFANPKEVDGVYLTKEGQTEFVEFRLPEKHVGLVVDR